jgi:hypothetical protein
MAETSGEQVAFGWAGEAGTAERPSTPPPSHRRGASPEPVERAQGASTERGGRGAADAPPAVGAPPLPPDEELWDVHAAARFLRRSVSRVHHRAEDGTLPVKRLAGWGVRFIPGELRAWVQEGGGGARR